MSVIGPTFPAEVAAAGLLGLAFSWSADGIAYGAGLSDADRDRIAAVFAAHDPTKLATPGFVTGNQWAFALGDLGIAAAWRAAVARSKDKDQVRIGLIARDTQLLVTDPLLIRVAANAGADASGKALIDVPTVFQRGLTGST